MREHERNRKRADWVRLIILLVELAGAIAELAHRALSCDFRQINPASARIILVQGEPRILPTFPASLTRKARKKLEQFGVEVRTGVHVTDVTADGVKIGDEYVAAKNVIWTAGVKASFTGLLAWLTWIAVHIFFLIGFRNRLLVLIQYAWAYFTYQQGARIILPENGAYVPQEERIHLSLASKPG